MPIVAKSMEKSLKKAKWKATDAIKRVSVVVKDIGSNHPVPKNWKSLKGILLDHIV